MYNHIKFLSIVLLSLVYNTTSCDCAPSAATTNATQPVQAVANNQAVKQAVNSNVATVQTTQSNLVNNVKQTIKTVTQNTNGKTTVANAVNTVNNNTVSNTANPEQPAKPSTYNKLISNIRTASKEYKPTNKITQGIKQGIINIESSKKLLADLPDVILKLNNHIEVIQGSITTIFRKYNGAFTNDISNGINDWRRCTNAGLIESLNNLKNSLESLNDKSKTINFIEGKYLQACKDSLDKAHYYCLGYETKCNEKLKELDKMNAITIKIKKHYNKQQLSELTALVSNCITYLTEISKNYFPTA